MGKNVKTLISFGGCNLRKGNNLLFCRCLLRNAEFSLFRCKLIAFDSAHERTYTETSQIVLTENKTGLCTQLGFWNVLERTSGDDRMRKCLKTWWPGTESNRRRRPFQDSALPLYLKLKTFLTAWMKAFTHVSEPPSPPYLYSRKTRSFVVARCVSFFSEFQPLAATGGDDRGFVAALRCGLGDEGDGVLAPPHFGIRGELRLRRERAAQFAVVSVEVKAGAERDDHELRELAKPVAERPLVAGQRRITTSDRLEVLWGQAGHVEHVCGRCTHLEGAALVIFNVVTNVPEQLDRQAATPSGRLHEHPNWRRNDSDRSPYSLSDRLRHFLRTQEFRSGGAVALSSVSRGIDQGRDSDSRDILVRRWRVAAIAEDPRKDAQMRG